MQHNEIYYPKDVVCGCISPLPLQCNVEVCLETAVMGHNKTTQTTWGNRNWFSSIKGTKAGESLLKQTSWIAAAELERLDSLQVLAE